MQLGHTLKNYLENFLWKNKKSDELFFTTFSIFQNFFFLFFEKQTHTHTRERERGFNTKAHHNSTQKP